MPNAPGPTARTDRGRSSVTRLRASARLWACAVTLLVGWPAVAAEAQAPSPAETPPPAETPRPAEPPLPILAAEPMEVVGDAPAEVDPAAPTSAVTTIDLEARPQHDLDLSGPLTLAPATVLRRYGGPGSLVTVSLRGSAADQVLVRLGDLPLSPPGGGLVDLSALSPSLLSSIAVVRGSEGAAYGAGSLGGVLHLEPLAPGPDRLTLSAAGGSFGTLDAALSGRARLGPVDTALAVNLQGTGGSFPFERDLTPSYTGDDWVTELRDNNDALLGSALAAGRARVGGGELRLTAFGHRGRRGVPGPVAFPTTEARADTTRGLAGASYARAPSGPHALGWAARLWAAGDGYGYEPGDTPGLDVSGSFDSTRRVLGAEAEAELLTGVHRARGILTATHEALWGTSADAARAGGAVALSDELFLAEGALTLHGALRLEAFEGLAPQLSPKLGAALVLLPGVTVSANLGRAIRAPSLQELYGETAFMKPNPDLRPEAALTLDAAVAVEGSAGRVKLGGWVSDYTDLISYELYPGFRMAPFNTRDARVLGLEVEGVARPFRWLRLTFAYALTDARNLDPGPNEKALPYRPPHRGTLRAEVIGGRFTTHLEVEGQSAVPRNRPATKFIPGRVLVGAGLSYRVAQDAYLGLLATNLLDHRRLEDLFGYPLPGRALLVTFRLTLSRSNGAAP